MNAQSVTQLLARPLSLVATLFALTTSSLVMAGGGNAGNPGILPPHSHAHGHSYGEWSAKWWQWALSLPAAGHPLIDGDCSVGQTGHVWFLGGSFASDTAVRTCTIPAGTALFFPILNTIYSETGPEDTDAIARAAVHSAIDQVVSATLTVDGRAAQNLIARYRTDSPFFDVSLPPTGGLYGPDFDSAVLRSVADGIYVMLAPLSVGQHTIHFSGAFADGFTLNVTYNLTVAPRRRN